MSLVHAAVQILRGLARNACMRRYSKGMRTGVSAADVAAYFVQLARCDGRDIDQLTTLKLIYFAQGMALARLSRPIFWEKIKAWPLGPVVPQVWQKTKVAGKGPVREIEGGKPERLSAADQAIVECVWRERGQHSSFELVDLTHEPGPWKSVRQANGLREGDRSDAEIPVAMIEEHFRGKLPSELTREELESFPRAK